MNQQPAFEGDATLGSLRRSTAESLRTAGIESAELDARILIAHALGFEMTALLDRPDTKIDAEAEARLQACTRRRLAGEPIARILGIKEFWSRSFALGAGTLVPRPETETLVEVALAALPDRNVSIRLLDLGVGSGVLLAAILIERPRAFGVGVDRSGEALTIARANLENLGVGARAALVRGHWGAALGRTFDLVVANPPYVATAAIATLSPEVRDYDPCFALDGGADGLDAYRAISSDLPRLLAPGGVAILELGDGQEAAVATLARKAGLIVNGAARRDLSGRPRALVLHADGGMKKTLGSAGEPH
jgi:release factor glutamine methyltransferase